MRPAPRRAWPGMMAASRGGAHGSGAASADAAARFTPSAPRSAPSSRSRSRVGLQSLVRRRLAHEVDGAELERAQGQVVAARLTGARSA